MTDTDCVHSLKQNKHYVAYNVHSVDERDGGEKKEEGDDQAEDLDDEDN